MGARVHYWTSGRVACGARGVHIGGVCASEDKTKVTCRRCLAWLRHYVKESVRELAPGEPCGKPCPIHGVTCCVVGMDPEMLAGMRRVFGDQLNRTAHPHLCVYDPAKGKGGMHSWHDGESIESIKRTVARWEEEARPWKERHQKKERTL